MICVCIYVFDIILIHFFYFTSLRIASLVYFCIHMTPSESPKPYHFRIYPSWAVFYVTFFCLTLLPAWLYWMLWKIKGGNGYCGLSFFFCHFSYFFYLLGSPDSMRDEMVKIWKAIRFAAALFIAPPPPRAPLCSLFCNY